MTTLAQLLEGTIGTSLHVNSTLWSPGGVVTTDALVVFGTGGLSPIPVDLMFSISFGVPAGTISDQGRVNLWAIISADGTNYTDQDLYGGANNYISPLRSPTNFKGPFPIYCNAVSITQVGVLQSLAGFLGGVLPAAIGVGLENRTGLTLTSPTVKYTALGYSNS